MEQTIYIWQHFENPTEYACENLPFQCSIGIFKNKNGCDIRIWTIGRLEGLNDVTEIFYATVHESLTENIKIHAQSIFEGLLKIGAIEKLWSEIDKSNKAFMQRMMEEVWKDEE